MQKDKRLTDKRLALLRHGIDEVRTELLLCSESGACDLRNVLHAQDRLQTLMDEVLDLELAHVF